MAIIIAGERSGVGKTTVTLALLSYLARQGMRVQSFKVGPDYIDPMFHRHVTGRSCRNLDPMLTSENYVQQCFDRHAQTASHALVEGVMGLFDGAAGQADFASTAHVARLLDLPILLVVGCGGMSHSIAAVVHGYRSLDPRLKIAGVVLNRVGSDRHLELLKAALEPLHIPILGVLRRQDEITIPDRHLGLVPTDELENLTTVIEQLAHLGETCFDWTQLMPFLEERQRAAGSRQQAAGGQGETQRSIQLELQSKAKFLTPHSRLPTPDSLLPSPHPRIAIAQDAAFSFYYADNLDLLKALGAELVPWSPLRDRALPDGVQGLYFGGGFPEVFAAALADNHATRNAVRAAIQAGMPTYAECGGLMYLCQTITNFEGQSFPMVGALSTTAMMGKRLTLGYRQAIAVQDSLLFDQGATVYGHEFHRSHLTHEPTSPLFSLHAPPIRLSAGRLSDYVEPPVEADTPPPTPEGWHLPNLHASYVHLHWGNRPDIPERFLQRCTESHALLV